MKYNGVFIAERNLASAKAAAASLKSSARAARARRAASIKRASAAEDELVRRSAAVARAEELLSRSKVAFDISAQRKQDADLQVEESNVHVEAADASAREAAEALQRAKTALVVARTDDQERKLRAHVGARRIAAEQWFFLLIGCILLAGVDFNMATGESMARIPGEFGRDIIAEQPWVLVFLVMLLSLAGGVTLQTIVRTIGGEELAKRILDLHTQGRKAADFPRR